MKVLIIGGSGFIGQHVTRQLAGCGHEVINFHRGGTSSASSAGIRDIKGNRNDLHSFREEFRTILPEVVIDMIAMSEADGQTLLNTFRGVAQRLVVISSADVYRNYELLRGVAEAAPDPNPITENSPLRENLFPYRARAKDEHDPFYNYDKILVERVVMNDSELPTSVLRLPAIYGPGDRQHRLFHYLKRMDDGRSAILVENEMMNWRWTRGYVENVAAAISWAAGDQNSTSRIYNVGDSRGLPEKDWIAEIADVVGWRGRVVPVEPSQLPEQMRSGLNWQHRLETDTSLIRTQRGFSEPISFRDGLRRTLEWERAKPPEAKPGDFDYETEDRVLKALGVY
ncbi:MAG TPA: NAD-dependent epimerase/dehydratase family protein [Pyrinomonadaceae bacterium]|jgi:nucleoside-diphosphate-sugar epimerase|nr:NAD-dependent epimerase/dehydratase family protein [Pyrinomonadaceae bacterium]